MATHKIPNGLVVAIAAAFYVHAVLTGIPLSQIALHTVVAFGFLLVLAVVGGSLGVGAGAVKLLSAGVLWFGFALGTTFVILACFSSGLGAVAWAFIKRDRNASVPMLPFAAMSALIVGQFGDVLHFAVA